MKATVDTNCLIAVDNREPGYNSILQILERLISDQLAVRVVAVSAAEKILDDPEPFNQFLALLDRVGFQSCEILKPMGISGISFMDHCVYASENDVVLRDRIWRILFPNLENVYPADGSMKDVRRWINRMCDCLMMHTHIKYRGDVFITLDQNFSKQSKIGQLIELGAGEIATPEDFLSSIQ